MRSNATLTRKRWMGILQVVLALAVVTTANAQNRAATQAPGLAVEAGLDPPAFSKTFDPGSPGAGTGREAIGPGSTTTLRFTIDNSGSSKLVTGIEFTDVLPTEITIADPASAFTDCTDGALSFPAPAGTTIMLSGARLSGGEICTVTVNVTSSTVGDHENVSGALMSSEGSPGTASATLTVDAGLPGFSKVFVPSSIPLGATSTLTFTVDNTANTAGVGHLFFRDILPTHVVVAPLPSASTDCGDAFGATITADPGTSEITLSAAGALPSFPALAAGSTCVIKVDVIADATGDFVNTSRELEIENSNFVPDPDKAGFAHAALKVPIDFLGKVFLDDPVAPGNEVTLQFTILNPDRVEMATDIAFDDVIDPLGLLTGLAPSEPLPKSVCGGMLDFATGTLSFTGGSLAGEESCTFSVTLLVPGGATPDTYTNTTDAISATIDGVTVVGNTATDELMVILLPTLTKEFMTNPVGAGGTTTLHFTITNGSSTLSLDEIAFDDVFDDVVPTATGGLTNTCGGTAFFTPFIDGAGENTPAKFTLFGASLGPSGSCTIDLIMDVVTNATEGIYPNTTSLISGLLGGTMPVEGFPASDDLVVVGGPSLIKEFIDDPVEAPGTVTLEFTLTHPTPAPGPGDPPVLSFADVTFTDDLDAALTDLVATGLPASACGGTVSTPDAGATIEFDGGTLDAGESCSFSVSLDVPMSAPPGPHTNTTSTLIATVGGVDVTGNPASDDLRIAGLTLTKEFIDDPVLPGETVTLEFVIENVNPTETATSITIYDNLATMLGGSPDITGDGVTVMDVCGPSNGTISWSSGDTNMIFTGGTLAPGEMCPFSVVLTVPAGAASGTYVNTTGRLVGGETASGFFAFMPSPTIVTFEEATDELIIDAILLQLTKSFGADVALPGGTVTLDFTLTNLDTESSITDIAFTDGLDAALSGLVAVGPLSAGDCDGTLSGTSTLTYSAGSLAPSASCSFTVTLDVPTDAVVSTIVLNETSDVTGLIGGLAVRGTPATDEVHIGAVIFTKAFDGLTTATAKPVLTFTLDNVGTSTVTDLGFMDDLTAVLAGLTIVTPLTGTGSCAGTLTETGGTSLSFTGGSIPGEETCSFSVELQMPATATPGDYVNTSDLLMGGVLASTATATLTVEPPPTFAKSFAPDNIGVGLISTLTFTIDNSASALAASSLDFTDNLPAGVEVANPAGASTTCTGGTLTATSGAAVISYTGGTVAIGASCTVTVDVTGTAVGVHTNTTGDLTSTSGNSGTASDDLTVNPQPGFSKSFSPTSVAVNVASTLTFTIDNTSSTVDATSLDLTDTLPTDLVVAAPSGAATTCTSGTLTAISGTGVITYTGGTVGAGASCTISVDVISDTGRIYTNTTGDLTSSLGNSGTATADLTVVGMPDVTVTKTYALIDINGIVQAGDVLEYTVTIINTGDADATSVILTDTVDPNTTLVCAPLPTPGIVTTCDVSSGLLVMEVGDIAPLSAVTVTLRVVIDNPLTGGVDDVSNQGTVSGGNFIDLLTDDPGDLTSDTDPTVTAVEAAAAVSATLDDTVLPKADGTDEVGPGDTIVYTAVISNTGDEGATDVIFTSGAGANTTLVCDLPTTPTTTQGTITTCDDGAGTLIVDLEMVEGDPRSPVDKQLVAAMVTFEVTVDVPLSSAISSVQTQGTVDYMDDAGAQQILTDDPATAGTPFDPTATLIDLAAELALTKTVDDETPDYDTDVVYTLTVKNNGTATPASAEVSDALPPGLVYVSHTGDGTFDPAANLWKTGGIDHLGTAEIMITATVKTVDPTTNTACIVTASLADPDESNNCDDATITPVAADLAITKTLVDATGDGAGVITATFKLTVTNKGPSAATDVKVEDPLPEGATYVSDTPTQGAYDSGVWTIGGLAKDASAMLTIVLTAPGGNDLVNIAVVSGMQPDQNEGNNRSGSQAQHDRPDPNQFVADLSLTKTVDNATPSVGEMILYTIEVTNNGPSATSGVEVCDSLPPNVQFVSAEATTPISYNDSLATWIVGHLPNASTVTLKITVLVTGTGEIINTAEIIKNNLPDRLANNNIASATINVSAAQARALTQAQVAMMAAEVPTEFELGSNYPNPFNPETVIPFAVPEQAHVRIAVYDLLGREVALLMDEASSVGRYELTWQAGRFPTGVYIVRMQAGSTVKTRRVTLLK